MEFAHSLARGGGVLLTTGGFGHHGGGVSHCRPETCFLNICHPPPPFFPISRRLLEVLWEIVVDESRSGAPIEICQEALAFLSEVLKSYQLHVHRRPFLEKACGFERLDLLGEGEGGGCWWFRERWGDRESGRGVRGVGR